MPKQSLFWSLTIAATTLAASVPAGGQMKYFGVNLAGAEFDSGTFYPNQQEVEYFGKKGFNTIRLPFGWERLQRSLNGSLDSGELSSITTFVDATTAKGIHVILDPHNYARYNGEVIDPDGGPGTILPSALGDFWSRLASVDGIKNNPRVIFGIMNEPNSMPTEDWKAGADAAIAAIRAVGANNLILVPGNAWTGAHSWLQNWYGTSNSVVFEDIDDPANNFAFDLHQYFDDDFSGRSANCKSATIGREVLPAVTGWLRANGMKAFLGEFGGGRNQTCYDAVDGALDYMAENADVWIGWAWWAAGPRWGDYIFTIEPTNNFTQDRPQMAVLQEHIPLPRPEVTVDSTWSNFSLSTQLGHQYQLQKSTDLTPRGWSDIGNTRTATGPLLTVPAPSQDDNRAFYRFSVTRD